MSRFNDSNVGDSAFIPQDKEQDSRSDKGVADEQGANDTDAKHPEKILIDKLIEQEKEFVMEREFMNCELR